MSIKILEIAPVMPTVSEALRYMRAGENPASAIVDSVERACDAVFSVARPRACYALFDIERPSCGEIKLGNMVFASKSLYDRLADCKSAYIFAVTVGSEVDRFIRAEAAHSAYRELCADCAGSCAVEAACDELNKKINEICVAEGKLTRTRFSVGYGDLSLEYQRGICTCLDTKKNIGVALGEGGMMMPAKSVTAIIGVL